MVKSEALLRYRSQIERVDTILSAGRVVEVNGLAIIAEGPPNSRVGDQVRVELERGDESHLNCEVVGFRGHRLVLMPIGPTTGVFPEAPVVSRGTRLTIPVSSRLLGRVLDGHGTPLDGRPPIISQDMRSADSDPPSPVRREPIQKVMQTGIRSIDGLLSIGCGQRIGIFAGTGVGKSVLLGMIARYTQADVNVICLVGERGRELRLFLEQELGEESMKRSVVFVATSDRSAMEKVYAAGFAASVAEYFREQGLHVNLYMDSVTRYVMALREIGIASGEQLGPGGFPPGVWLRLSRLLERSGNMAHGSITGFYTVLVEADDLTEPVADNCRGILDGHIVLSRRLAQRNHYPAIEVTESISRVMDQVVDSNHLTNALKLRRLLAAYRENEELINLGAYAQGSNRDVDEALEKMTSILHFLQQDISEGSDVASTLGSLQNIIEPEL